MELIKFWKVYIIYSLQLVIKGTIKTKKYKSSEEINKK